MNSLINSQLYNNSGVCVRGTRGGLETTVDKLGCYCVGLLSNSYTLLLILNKPRLQNPSKLIIMLQRR